MRDLDAALSQSASAACSKTIVIVDKSLRTHELAALQHCFYEFQTRGAAIFLLKSFLPDCLNQLQTSVTLASDVLDRQNWQLLDQTVYPLVRDWHKTPDVLGNSLTEYHGYPLGDFLEHSFSFELLPVYWCVFAINKFLRQRPADSKIVFVVKDTNSLASYYADKSTWNFFFLKKGPELNDAWWKQNSTALLRDMVDQLGYLNVPGYTTAKLIIDASGILRKLSATGAVQFTPLRRMAKAWLLARCLIACKAGEIAANYGGVGRAITDRIETAVSHDRLAEQFQLFPELRTTWFSDRLKKWEPVYPKLAAYTHCMEVFLRVAKPEGFITNTVQFGTKKILSYAAKKYSIPTAQRQHGIIQLRESEARIHSDTALIWGKGTSDLYLELGNPPEKLKITGNFQFDAYKSYAEMSKVEALKSIADTLHLAPDKPLYVLLSQPFLSNFGSRVAGDESDRACEVFAKAAALKPNAQFVIKLHPIEPEGHYDELIALVGVKNLISVKNANLPLLLRASSLVCAVQSTTLAEAMVVNTPFVQFTFFEPWIQYAHNGAGCVANNEDELLDAIGLVEQNIYNTPAREKARIEWLQHHIHTLNWDASHSFSQALGEIFWPTPSPKK